MLPGMIVTLRPNAVAPMPHVPEWWVINAARIELLKDIFGRWPSVN